jgi:hypothetical protein
MTEAELAKVTKQILEYSGLVFWRNAVGAVQHRIGNRVIMKPSPIRGFPDWSGITRSGQFWALELKSKTGRVESHQVEWMEKLTKSHAIVGVARSVEEVLQFVEICGGKVPKIL